MSNAKVFRQTSLDRLASPEQLDQLMQVTTSKGWLALSAIGAVLLMALVWGWLGSIPDQVSGVGMLVKSGGVLEVVPAAAGRVIDVAVRVGDSVHEGQIVARVNQAELESQLIEARSRLASLQSRHEQLTTFNRVDLVLQDRYSMQRRTALEQSIAAQEQSIAVLAEKASAQERLVDRGLLTRGTLLATRQQYEAAREKLSAARGELVQLQSQKLEFADGQRRARDASAYEVEEAGRQIADLERRLEAAVEVTSPYSGRVLEVLIEQGGLVGRGDPILTLAPTGRTVNDLEGVIFVPSAQGKRVRPGMVIHLSPSTVRQEEFGMMLGRVTYVSDFPATPRGMNRILKNDQLVTSLAGGDAPYEVHADLLVSPSTPSHYRWTSANGPPTRIQSGTMALGLVTVATRRPIEMVIPWLRKKTGL